LSNRLLRTSRSFVAVSYTNSRVAQIEAPATDPLSKDSGDESELDDGDSKESAGDLPVAGINGVFEDEEEGEDSNQDEEDDDIPLSDLESLPEEEKEDIIPHQRLTINNTAALRNALASISIPVSTLPFSEHQSLISTDPLSIPDVNDDLTRELAFYTSSLSGARLARSLLKKEGVPFSRPADFFAEMFKSDDHMGKVKKKLYDEAAAKKASVEARKQRDLKKFGKQVQIAKLQERDRAKKESLEKINSLKRSSFTFISQIA
jgi:rRNA-processing protein EBP2